MGPEDHFSILQDLQREALAKKVPGMVPCLSYVTHRVELLQETPVRVEDKTDTSTLSSSTDGCGDFNLNYFRAAINIFGELQQLQELKYSPYQEDEVLYYFLRM